MDQRAIADVPSWISPDATAFQPSCYSMPLTELKFSKDNSLLVSTLIFDQWPKLARMGRIPRNPRSTISRDDTIVYFSTVPVQVGHVLLHFLYTGTYGCLRPQDLEVPSSPAVYASLSSEQKEDLLELSVCIGAYSLAQDYEITPLEEMLRGEMDRLAKTLPCLAVIGILQIHANPRVDDDWICGFLKRQIQALCLQSSNAKADTGAKSEKTIMCNGPGSEAPTEEDRAGILAEEYRHEPAATTMCAMLVKALAELVYHGHVGALSPPVPLAPPLTSPSWPEGLAAVAPSTKTDSAVGDRGEQPPEPCDVVSIDDTETAKDACADEPTMPNVEDVKEKFDLLGFSIKKKKKNKKPKRVPVAEPDQTR